jgi:hypothetical protein
MFIEWTLCKDILHSEIYIFVYDLQYLLGLVVKAEVAHPRYLGSNPDITFWLG